MSTLSTYSIRNSIILFLIFSVVATGYSQVSCPSYNSMCITKAPFELSGGNPEGGIYSGAGVSGNIFNPVTAGIGLHELTYTYTNLSGTAQICTFYMYVYETIPFICVAENSVYCIGSKPEQIQDCIYFLENDIQYKFTGPGITDNIFYPAVAGLGGHNYTLSLSDVDGCTTDVPGFVYVQDGNPPSIICPEDITVLNSSVPPFIVTGGNASDADWSFYSGPGIENEMVFNPSAAGNGPHVITYHAHYFGLVGNLVCYNECDFKINVGPLPVTLTRFNAENQENSISLQWETTMETAFDYFVLERSGNAKTDFKEIYRQSGNNAGNKYAFADQTAQKGYPYYYRLKMVDNDGSFAYSKIAWAIIEDVEKLKIFPNPASHELNVESPTEMAELKLINISGSELLVKKIEKIKNKRITLPASLPAATYLLQIKTIDGTYHFSRVLIE